MDTPTPRPRSRVSGRSAARVDPADRRQLAERPVSVRRILALFRPYKVRVGVVVALIIVSSAVGLGQPFLVRAIIDDAIPRQDVGLLTLCVGAMIGIAALTAVLGVLQTWLSTAMGQQVMHRLRTDLFAHLQRQSVGFFTRTRGGEVQSRLINDVGGMQSVVTSTATSVASNVTVVVGTAIAMAALSWRLSLLSLVVLPPSIWLTRQVARMRQRITGDQQRTLADLHVQIDEGLSVSGVLLAKTTGAAPAMNTRFGATSDDLVGLAVRSQLAGRWRMATMNVIFAVIPAAIYLVAGLPVTSGAMTIGTLVAFVGLQGTLFRPLMSLLNVGVELTASLALFSRIFEYLDLPVEIDDPATPRELGEVRGEVRFEHVSFGYGTDAGAGADSGAGPDVLHDIDLVVPAGTSLALVGETGSGKSTLAALAARLHDPTAGRVLLDGTDVRDVRLGDLANAVGVVTQETYLLHASVRENLLHARPGASEEEVEVACRAARIHDLIVSLPQGYDTVVGSRGHRFSGGEKQRMAIARTLLRDPRVLVLDEATSALDNETERAIQVALDEASRGRTTITIAHRLSTVRDADQIAVLDHGRVVEVGTHEGLLLAGGRYATLVRSGLGQSERIAA